MRAANSAVTIALGVEYDGALFSGFQRQRGQPTVQAALEGALSQVAAAPVKVVAAGRTDAGVHATNQVVSFRTHARRPLEAWRRGVNALAGAGIAVLWSRQASTPFHARFSAVARRYAYVFLESETPPALLRGRVAWSRRPLDDAAMQEAAQALPGERDFTSFRAAGCQARTPFRCVHAATVFRRTDRVVFDISANAFVLRMVRNIAGALERVGRGDAEPAYLTHLLELKDRTAAPRTAAAAGLYLTQVTYPDFPTQNRPPPIL